MTTPTAPPSPPPGPPYYGPPPKYQPPPPPPAAKKHRKWPWIVLAVVVLIGIIGAMNGGKSTTTTATAPPPTSVEVSAPVAAPPESAGVPEAVVTPAPEAAATPVPEAAAPPVPGIGTAVRDGKFEFIVQSVEGGKKEIGDQYLSTKAQGEFVVVTIQVTNIGQEPQSFFGDNVKAFDAQGRQFSSSTEAAIYLADSNSLYKPVNPGNSLTGRVVFDVPVGTQLSTIELHDSAFSDGVTVQL